MTQQLRLQTEVRAEAIQGKGSTDKFLIRCRNSGDPPVEISQHLTQLIDNADAPKALFRAHR